MLLLVSVSTANEAAAALAGGADVIDAKDPDTGALGQVALDEARRICAAIGGMRPVTAALGDVSDDTLVERDARSFAAAGARLMKIGFAGISDSARAEALTEAAVRGVLEGSGGMSGIVVVAYADARGPNDLKATDLFDIAVTSRAAGFLLDTADKRGHGLRNLVTDRALAAWARRGRDHGLLIAFAGKLTLDDLPAIRDTGADIAGVRGAACEGGRTGRVDIARVRQLRSLCVPETTVPPPGGDLPLGHALQQS